jgi:hypothetical protein
MGPFVLEQMSDKSSLSLRERGRVRGQSWIMQHCCPLIRPSATFSFRPQRVLREKGIAAN